MPLSTIFTPGHEELALRWTAAEREAASITPRAAGRPALRPLGRAGGQARL